MRIGVAYLLQIKHVTNLGKLSSCAFIVGQLVVCSSTVSFVIPSSWVALASNHQNKKYL
jgi:hypothetical protein